MAQVAWRSRIIFVLFRRKPPKKILKHISHWITFSWFNNLCPVIFSFYVAKMSQSGAAVNGKCHPWVCSVVKKWNGLGQQIRVLSLWIIKSCFTFSSSTQVHWRVRGAINMGIEDLLRKQPSSFPHPKFLIFFLIFIQLMKMSNTLM